MSDWLEEAGNPMNESSLRLIDDKVLDRGIKLIWIKSVVCVAKAWGRERLQRGGSVEA